MAKIINQAFGKKWRLCNADCVFETGDLSEDSIDLAMHGPTRSDGPYTYNDKASYNSGDAKSAPKRSGD